MRRYLHGSFAALLGLCFQTSHAALVTLTQSPLSLSTAVPPNVFFQVDDSGSMDWEILMSNYWEACAYDSNYPGGGGTSCGSFLPGSVGLINYANGRSRPFGYIYDNSTNIYNDYNCTATALPVNSVEGCPVAGSYFDWRGYSPSTNLTYYDPSQPYTPWVYECTSGTPCADASFTSALDNPVRGQPGYTVRRNLTGSKYEIWIDDKGFSGTRPLRGTAINVTNGENEIVDLWDSHVTFIFDGSSIRVYQNVYAPTSAGMNLTQTLVANLSGSACYDILGTQDAVQDAFSGAAGYTSTGGAGCRSVNEARQNFANWYQYSRRRSQNARGAIAYVVNQYPEIRFGMNTINNAFFREMPPGSASDFVPYNERMIADLMNMQWQRLGTPNRSALNRVGQYYSDRLSGTNNPIIEACQQNFTVFLTDGFWTNPDSVPGYIGDIDGDGISQTFADIAYYYYRSNLQPAFPPNEVPPNSWDPATWLHMVTFPLAFGISGNLVAGPDGWPTPALQINSNWGNPFTDDAAKVDDLWHAAFNSRGEFLQSQSAAQASIALGGFLNSITQRSVSAASVAQNSTVLNLNAVIYQATLNSQNWTGDLLAYSINIAGQIASAPNWSANCVLTGGTCLNPAGNNAGISPNSRVIITRNWTGDNNGIPFRWPASYDSYKVRGRLPENLFNFLSLAPNNPNTRRGRQIRENQNYGQALLDYLRGDRRNESQNGGSYGFRDRVSILSDIVHSGPIYVPAPYRNYPDSLETSPYSAFKASFSSRSPVVYVGANDGMLHGFQASDGSEVFAYVPGIRQVYENMPQLSTSTYPHYYFVDGSPTEADAFFGGRWRTILTGALQNGGQGIYAVDITDPSQYNEGNAAALYLWEFTDEDDADVGYVHGNVSVTKVRNGTGGSEWAVIFSNGYNSTQPDGYASTTGEPTLFILLLDRFNGSWRLNTNYYKISIGGGSVNTPNGLAPPYAVDIDADFISDYVYAGDQRGNLWRFDLTGSSASNWQSDSTRLFRASFATNRDQPITARPVVGAHPKGISYGVMVYFGTGMYLQPSDNSTTNQVTQAFYGIWDKLGTGGAVRKSELLQQTILGEPVGPDGTEYRLVSNNTINWENPPPAQNLGWYVDLIVAGASSNFGERQISAPILRNDNVIFTTLIPSNNACAPGGTGWLMELNAGNGGTGDIPIFDVNGDGQFTQADYLSITAGGGTVTQPPAGIKSTVGVTGTPAIMLSQDKTQEFKIISGSQGLDTILENPATGPSGRQNWRQIF